MSQPTNVSVAELLDFADRVCVQLSTGAQPGKQLAIEQSSAEPGRAYQRMLDEQTPPTVTEDDTDDDDDAADSAPSRRKALPMLDRSAFLYQGEKLGRDFQCNTCMLWTGPEHNTCAIHGKRPIDGDDSCNFYLYGKPNPKLASRERELVKPEESGLVSRPVRCQNCGFFRADKSGCHFYHTLNTLRPETFRLDERVEPGGCCTANSKPGVRMSLAPEADMVVPFYKQIRAVVRGAISKPEQFAVGAWHKPPPKTPQNTPLMGSPPKPTTEAEQKSTDKAADQGGPAVPPNPEHHAAAQSWLGMAEHLPVKMYQAARDHVAKHYQQLEQRYGRAMATTIIGTALAGTALPVPGSGLVAAAPLVGLAELYHHLHGGQQQQPEQPPVKMALDDEPTDSTSADPAALAKEFVHKVIGDWSWVGEPGTPEENKSEADKGEPHEHVPNAPENAPAQPQQANQHAAGTGVANQGSGPAKPMPGTPQHPLPLAPASQQLHPQVAANLRAAEQAIRAKGDKPTQGVTAPSVQPTGARFSNEWQHHAPAGGADIGGTHFTGGEFIPNEVWDKMTSDEAKSLTAGYHKDADDGRRNSEAGARDSGLPAGAGNKPREGGGADSNTAADGGAEHWTGGDKFPATYREHINHAIAEMPEAVQTYIKNTQPHFQYIDKAEFETLPGFIKSALAGSAAACLNHGRIMFMEGKEPDRKTIQHELVHNAWGTIPDSVVDKAAAEAVADGAAIYKQASRRKFDVDDRADQMIARRMVSSIRRGRDKTFGLELDLMIPPAGIEKLAQRAGVKILAPQYLVIALHSYMAKRGGYQLAGQYAREEVLAYRAMHDDALASEVFKYSYPAPKEPGGYKPVLDKQKGEWVIRRVGNYDLPRSDDLPSNRWFNKDWGAAVKAADDANAARLPRSQKMQDDWDKAARDSDKLSLQLSNWERFLTKSGHVGWKNNVSGERRYQANEPGVLHHGAPDAGAQQSAATDAVPAPESDPATAELRDNISKLAQASLTKSAGTIAPALGAQYAATLDRVLKQMPSIAMRRMTEALKKFRFYPSIGVLTKAGLDKMRDSGQTGGDEPQPGDLIGGWYDTSTNTINLDGGADIGGDYPDSAGHVYAHELGHAIDFGGVGRIPGAQPLSAAGTWLDAWTKEIMGPVEHNPVNYHLIRPTMVPRLTEYARTTPQEGFAEFCRLLYNRPALVIGNRDAAWQAHLQRVEHDFPQCWEFFKKHSLVPDGSVT